MKWESGVSERGYPDSARICLFPPECSLSFVLQIQIPNLITPTFINTHKQTPPLSLHSFSLFSSFVLLLFALFEGGSSKRRQSSVVECVLLRKVQEGSDGRWSTLQPSHRWGSFPRLQGSQSCYDQSPHHWSLSLFFSFFFSFSSSSWVRLRLWEWVSVCHSHSHFFISFFFFLI